MHHGTIFGRLSRLTLAVSVVAVVAPLAWADGATDPLSVADPFVAYDLQMSQAVQPTVTPVAARVAADISQTSLQIPDAVTPVACGCDQSADDCTSIACGDACTTCCRPAEYWYAGVEATFLVPDFGNGGVAAYELIDTNAPARDVTLGGVIDPDDMEYGPRVWVGAQVGCWGVAARFWHLDGDNVASDLFAGVDTNDIGYDVSGNFEAYTIDLEAQRTICLCNSQHVVSFGVRYASIENNGQVTTIADTADGLLITRAGYRQLAHGTGITTALSGTKPIGCSCVKAFYNVRGSLLWGPVDTAANTMAAAGAVGGGVASSVNGAATHLSDDMFIGEVQVGLQIDRRLQCVPADAFVRVAAEYQYWTADKGLSTSTSFAGFGAPPTSVASTTATVGGVEMSLYGISIATGVAW